AGAQRALRRPPGIARSPSAVPLGSDEREERLGPGEPQDALDVPRPADQRHGAPAPLGRPTRRDEHVDPGRVEEAQGAKVDDDVRESRVEQFLDGGADVPGDSEVQLAGQPHDPDRPSRIGSDVADELGGWSTLLHWTSRGDSYVKPGVPGQPVYGPQVRPSTATG